MYPIRFEPIYQNYIWGGERIPRKYRRPKISGQIAESWEVSDRDDGMSVVANGSWKGKTLHALVEELGEKLLGVGQKFERFPLLLKIIDAKEALSVQVHPDERMAEELKGEPKSEMWFMLEDGAVYAGLKKEIEKEDLLKAISKKKIDDVLEKIEVHKGDVIDIPGGRVHAICAGCLLYEIQQNSNTTYRLYDWDRVEKNGKPRPLHLEEALASIRWHDRHAAKIPHHHLESDLHHQLITLNVTPFFVAERIDVFDHLHIAQIPKTFQIFFCIEGEGTISSNQHKEPFSPGLTYLIPAASGAIEIEGKCEALRVRLP